MNCDHIFDRLIAMCQKAEREANFFFTLVFWKFKNSQTLTHLRRLEESRWNTRDKVICGSSESELHQKFGGVHFPGEENAIHAVKEQKEEVERNESNLIFAGIPLSAFFPEQKAFFPLVYCSVHCM